MGSLQDGAPVSHGHGAWIKHGQRRIWLRVRSAVPSLRRACQDDPQIQGGRDRSGFRAGLWNCVVQRIRNCTLEVILGYN